MWPIPGPLHPPEIDDRADRRRVRNLLDAQLATAQTIKEQTKSRADLKLIQRDIDLLLQLRRMLCGDGKD